MRSHSAMLDFRIGEKVKFRPDGNPELIGTITRYKKRRSPSSPMRGSTGMSLPAFSRGWIPPPQKTQVPTTRVSSAFPIVPPKNRPHDFIGQTSSQAIETGTLRKFNIDQS